MVERIGAFLWLLILIIWYNISGRISRQVRYLLDMIVIIADIILSVILIKVWKVNLIFGFLISGVFFLSEYFPKSGKRALEMTQQRRIEISVWEDYFFVTGVTMMALNLFFFFAIKNI